MQKNKICLAIIMLVTSIPLVGQSDPTLVKSPSGSLTGELVGPNKDVRVYRGVPYARPPVGDLRWKAPLPVEPWKEPRAMNSFGPACAQIEGSAMFPKPKNTSEDCLYLNIWMPANPGKEKLPVMLWIHGGSYLFGSGELNYYSGEHLARQGVIVVTINYRLGIFGFFGHPELSTESKHNSSGNYGLLDQIESLRWVQKNIGAFGGDKNRVTAFGESAGAGSVLYLMSSPLAKGLFQRAISQSGVTYSPSRHLNLDWGQEPMEKMGVRVAMEMGAANIKDLRAMSADDVIKKSNTLTGVLLGDSKGNKYGPIVDGWVVTDEPALIFARGKHNRMPLLIGANSDEGTLFTFVAPAMTEEQYRAAVAKAYPDDTAAVLKYYPYSPEQNGKKAFTKLLGDAAFVCSAGYFADLNRKFSDVFLYHYSWVAPTPRGKALGAFHSSEIPHVFGTSTVTDGGTSAAPKAMLNYWANFAKTGNPNGDGLPDWTIYQSSTAPYIEFGNEIKSGAGMLREQCALFEKILEPKLKH